MRTFDASGGTSRPPLVLEGLPIMAHLNPLASALALSVSAGLIGLLGCSADGGQGGGDQNPMPGFIGGPGTGAVPAGAGNTPPVGAGNQPPVGGGNFPPVGAGNQPPVGGGNFPPVGTG